MGIVLGGAKTVQLVFIKLCCRVLNRERKLSEIPVHLKYVVNLYIICFVLECFIGGGNCPLQNMWSTCINHALLWSVSSGTKTVRSEIPVQFVYIMLCCGVFNRGRKLSAPKYVVNLYKSCPLWILSSGTETVIIYYPLFSILD